jgi:hypothetical protein
MADGVCAPFIALENAVEESVVKARPSSAASSSLGRFLLPGTMIRLDSTPKGRFQRGGAAGGVLVECKVGLEVGEECSESIGISK